ncbi:MAG: Threonylcarbamoyladenosine tRNA methylthiotransferase MtaB [Candidatus Dichloromethanomonas elyunquensis]|nr:MAG: Threonylcarbamoyladenosine tRNA methylthiotransferase MtaB [Candidatus Dichloromethanomonas elyunquensis]
MEKVSFLTLGCKVNQTESEALAQFFQGEGYDIVQETEEPDIFIINTCTVTGMGSVKSRKLIRRIAKEHPSSTLVVMGCYSQTKPEEIAELEGVDLIMGTQDRFSILKHLRTLRQQTGNDSGRNKQKKPVQTVRPFVYGSRFEELPLLQSESRTRAMLKIQDGCSQFCTYCIVPYARGPSRSRDPENVIAEASRLLEAGYKEIVLTGIHIGVYGQELNHKINLAGLIARLVELRGMSRLRLGSIEPMEFTPELLEVIVHKAVCPHFHIPLQSGSDIILEKMRRPYTVREYALLLGKIRENLPDAAIAADVMTGFPGETDEIHQEALKFAENCEFAGIHVFPYSRRPGTPAADMPGQIPKGVKAARVKEFMKAGRKSREKYVTRFIHHPVEVLLEKVSPDGTAQGHTGNYLELRIPPELNPGFWQPGQLVNCVFKKEYLFS